MSFGERALARLDARKTKPQSWYLDVTMLRKYYLSGTGGGRVYHHTAPINMTYALHEALTIVLEEGLDARIERHARAHQRLRAGLEKLGISYVPKRSLHSLNCIHIPAGKDDAAVRKRLLDEYGIDLALVFPSIGLTLGRDLSDRDLANAVIRAYNVMAADTFAPYADRLIPAGVLSLAHPDDAIDQMTHAASLGLKVLVTGGTITRTIEEDADWQPDPAKRRVYIDALAVDSPYDYDPVSYSSLRGVVDFDEEDNSWHIIYNVTPNEKDKLGGGVRLLPHPALKTLRNGDVVLIEGKVDYENLDRRGKPQYRISYLARLEAGK